MAIAPAQEPKKVMVIGGGLSGMETAMTARRRGHRVTLYEENDELGGQWHLASIPPCKGEFVELFNYLLRELHKLEVTLRLGAKATAKTVVEENPDVVVVATGAVPCKPEIPGVEGDNVVLAWDVLAGRVQVGHQVTVIGGNGLGLETADFLATQGKGVQVVEALQHIGRDLGPTVRWHLRHRLAEQGVSLLTSTRAIEINDEGVLLVDSEGTSTSRAADTVVLAVGVVSRDELVNDVKDMVGEVYVIGDAAEPRNALFAMREGAEVGRKI